MNQRIARSAGIVFIVLLLGVGRSDAQAKHRSSHKKIAADSTSVMKKDSVADFETIVGRLRSFFESGPIFLSRESYSSAPTGEVFMLFKHELQDVSYDIKKTESIITPLIGTIVVTAQQLKNAGDHGEYQSQYIHDWFHTTLAACLSDTLFHPRGSPGSPLGPMTFRYTYAFQKGQWVYKGTEFFTGASTETAQMASSYYLLNWDRPENVAWGKSARGQ